MIKCDLMKLSCAEFSLVFFGTARKDCVVNTGEMFSFPSLINNPVTICSSFFINKHISNHIIKYD